METVHAYSPLPDVQIYYVAQMSFTSYILTLLSFIFSKTLLELIASYL